MARYVVLAQVFSFFLSAEVIVGAQLNVWPLPQHVSEASGDPIAISESLGFYTDSKSEILKSGILRYQEIIQELLSSTASNGRTDESMLLGVNLKTNSDDESLDAQTSYKYSLLYKGGEALEISADSPYGALYGLETLSQLIVKGQLVHRMLDITDYPTYKHRGLMLDTGRRFCPIEFIHNLLDAMSYVKYNVFHWHFADFCRFSIESEDYPDLRNGETQFYTKKDVAGIIQYAKERGIRVVPEVEIAMHAHGMRGLNGSGLNFCDTNKMWQLYNDPQGETLGTMKNLLSEMSSLFPDKLFHLGCDETSVTGNCTIQNTKDLETSIFHHMQSLGKTPFVWEEALSSTGAAIDGTVIQVWRDAHVKDIVNKGFQCVDASNVHFYLDTPTWPASAFWADIANGVPSEKLPLVLGGEVAMWTDYYCFIQQCVTPSKKPVAYWMFDEKYDAEFALSVSGVIWPRAIIGAGSFWNYQPSLDPQSYEFKTLYSTANTRLQNRGIITCPNDCTCDNVNRCGKPIRQGVNFTTSYTPSSAPVNKTNIGAVLGVSLLCVIFLVVMVWVTRKLYRRRTSNYREIVMVTDMDDDEI